MFICKLAICFLITFLGIAISAQQRIKLLNNNDRSLNSKKNTNFE